MSSINRINYKENSSNLMNFEIVDLQLFFSTRPQKLLEKDFRLNFWNIIYITDGQGMHYIDFDKFDYKAGDIIFIQQNQVHRFKVNNDVKGYIIHINEPFLLDDSTSISNVFLEFIDKIYSSPIVSVDTSINSTNRKLIKILYTEYIRNAANVNIIFIKSLFDSFILSIRQQFLHHSTFYKTSEYKIFAEFRKLVDKHYNQRLNMDAYAEMMGLSKKSINQATRTVADMSAKEYVNQRLFLEIKRHLSQGELLNYEIAELLNFDEPANMTKFFKKHAGISPKEFRANLTN